MKKKSVIPLWMYYLTSILLFISIGNTTLCADEAHSDTLPEPDRTAEDFVIVSLCIADPTDWQQDALGTLGHAFLRLQCPYYGLDYCFSYEGENINDNLYRYLSGKTKMGMFAVPTAEYLEDYKRWNRSVREYFLDLPPAVEVRLWEVMDNHLTGGITLRQDLIKYGCAITVVRYVKRALGNMPIVYSPQPAFDGYTRREISYRALKKYPWLRLTSMLLIHDNYDKECPIDEKLIVPADLARVWQESRVADRTLATYKGDIVKGAPLDNSEPWFTPMLLALVLVVLSIIFTFTDYPYYDWLLLTLQTIVGITLIILWIMMTDLGVAAYLLLVLFNPLPAICWKWRRYWSISYAIILSVWALTITLLPHQFVDPSIVVLSIAFIIMYSKEYIRRFLFSIR